MTKFQRLWGQIEDVLIGTFSMIALSLVCFEVVARYFAPSVLPDWATRSQPI